ncbi:MAG TPA: hypothetical protein EYQ00_11295 [Dehalococcoidia bacterium]|nr:hypothetical protein [Dehalococcoidia bacterium]
MPERYSSEVHQYTTQDTPECLSQNSYNPPKFILSFINLCQ